MEHSASRQLWKTAIYWFFSTLCFVGLPFAISHFGLESICRQRIEDKKDTWRKDMQLFFVKTRQHPSAFWATTFSLIHRKLEKKRSVGEKDLAAVGRFFRKIGLPVDFAFLDSQHHVVKKTSAKVFSNITWEELSLGVSKLEKLRALGKIPGATVLGLPEYGYNREVLDDSIKDYCQSGFPLLLFHGVPSRNQVFFFTGKKTRLILLFKNDIFLELEALFRAVVLLNFRSLKNYTVGYAPVFRLNRPILAHMGFPTNEVASNLRKHQALRNDKLEVESSTLFFRSWEFGDFYGFICRKVDRDFRSIRRQRNIGIFLCVLLFLPLLAKTFRVFFRNEPWACSIHGKVAFLLIYATGLPLFFGFFLITNFLVHEKKAMIQAYEERGVEILKRVIDHQALFEKKLGIDFGQTMKDVINLLKRMGLTKASSLAVQNRFKGVPVQDFFIFQRDSEKLLTNYEVLEKDQESRPPETFTRGNRDSYFAGTKLIPLVGQVFFSDLNGTSFEMRKSPELVLAIESLLQRPMEEIVQFFFRKKGVISSVGFFGGHLQQSFFDICRDPITRTYDWTYFISFNDREMERESIRQGVFLANKNEDGLRVFAHRPSDQEMIFPSSRLISNEIRRRLRTKRIIPPELTVKNECFLLFRLEGVSWDIYAILPDGKILRELNRKKFLAVTLALLCFIFMIALVRYISEKLLDPINLLVAATSAIGEREFGYRLPPMAADELGNLGKVFNEVMVSFRELEVARIVQESFFPKEKLNCGKIEVFGKNCAVKQLGGDYFDYFKVGENKMAVIIGDVAGNGVPAALIMSVAKTLIVGFEGYSKDFQEILKRLNDEFNWLRERHSTTAMTMLFGVIDGISGQIEFVNCGHCPPVLLRIGGSEPVSFSVRGNPLGMAPVLSLSVEKIQSYPGDSLVFFSDGLSDFLDDRGEKFGIEKTKRLIAEAKNFDSEKSVNSIFQKYFEKTVTGQQDDVTVIVMSNVDGLNQVSTS